MFSTLLSLVTRDELHEFLDRWAIAEWAVAIGTAALAVATYKLARGARKETDAIIAQSENVAEQVKLQREQMRRAELPRLFPAQPDSWTSDHVVVRNVGSGIGMNVTGWLFSRFSAEQPWYRSELVPGLFGGGDLIGLRLTAHRVGRWDGAYGLIDYQDPSGGSYRCSWKLLASGGKGSKRSVHVVAFGPADEVPDPEPPTPLGDDTD